MPEVLKLARWDRQKRVLFPLCLSPKVLLLVSPQVIRAWLHDFRDWETSLPQRRTSSEAEHLPTVMQAQRCCHGRKAAVQALCARSLSFSLPQLSCSVPDPAPCLTTPAHPSCSLASLSISFYKNALKEGAIKGRGERGHPEARNFRLTHHFHWHFECGAQRGVTG